MSFRNCVSCLNITKVVARVVDIDVVGATVAANENKSQINLHNLLKNNSKPACILCF